jgi:Family of unknown function (DUF5908)
MPIEIKELNIRINVNQGQPEQNSAPQEGNNDPQTLPDKNELMAECVEQVMELIKNKQER